MEWKLSLPLLAAGLLPACSLATHRPDEAETSSSFARSMRTRFTYKASVPAIPSGTKQLRLWLPIPSDNAYQTVWNVKVESAAQHRITTESRYGNRMVFVEATNPGPSLEVSVSFDVERTEAAPLVGGGSHNGDEDLDRFLKPDSLVPIGGRYAEIAKEVVGSRRTAIEKMRAIYEHTVANMKYDYNKQSPKLGVGDVAFVCDYKMGNCSDLHSYVISLARSQGVPAYLEYGFPITGIPVPNPLPTKGTIGGYHCWTWYHDDRRGWLPLDASDGRRWLDSNRPDVKEKLYGNLVLERSAVAMSRGRDIVLDPPQKQGPLNYFIYPYAEADGDAVDAKWVMEYELLRAPSAATNGGHADAAVAKAVANTAAFAPTRSFAPSAQQPAGTASKQKATLYGFVRTDMIWDSDQPNPNNQFPFFINSPDTPGQDGGRFTLHPRLTRLGINVADTGDVLPGWTVGGNVEIDFQGGGSESRQTPRIRHAYAQVKRPGLSVLVGQTWDLISPLIPSPNDDSLMWNAGNLGDRRPQIRVTFDRPGAPIVVAIALGLTGAIDAKDLDGNGVRDGEESGAPNLQVRAVWNHPKATLGVWGHVARERTASAVAGERSFESSSIGADFKVQLSPMLELLGEVWNGHNLSDFRGGIGQGVDVSTATEIASAGGWVELGLKTSPKHRIAVGFTLDDPDDDDVPANGRTKNFAWYVHNKWAIAEAIDIGLNVLGWTTEFNGLRTGRDTRINLFATYKF